MTPALRRLIEKLTCRECGGNGVFTSEESTPSMVARGIRNVTHRNCDRCRGTGIEPVIYARDLS